MSVKFIHTGDIHFGVENYGKLDPSTGLHSRFKDFIKCFEKIMEYAVKHDVDFVLICGDIYHTPRPTPTHQREFARCITKLMEKSIPLIMVVGNHDNPVSFGKATSLDIFSALNIENIYVISRPQTLTIELKEKKKIQIAGFPWPTRSRIIDKEEYKNLNAGELDEELQTICEQVIDNLTDSLSPDIPAIFAGHLSLAEAQYSGSERTTLLGKDPVIFTGKLAREEFSYVALGHIHKHQNLNSTSSPPVVYSGNIERVDFNEERDDKGFCLVEIDDAKKSVYRFIKTPSRKLVTIDVDVRERLDPTWDIITEIQKHNIEGAVVRIIYLTTSNWEQPLRLQEIHEALSSAYWVQGIIRKTEEKEVTLKTAISENLSLREALDKYIKQENLEKYADDIKIYAGKLQEEISE